MNLDIDSLPPETAPSSFKQLFSFLENPMDGEAW